MTALEFANFVAERAIEFEPQDRVVVFARHGSETLELKVISIQFQPGQPGKLGITAER